MVKAATWEQRKIQCLRTIDKVDRLGLDAVTKLLMEPMPDGPDLDAGQAFCIGAFLEAGTGGPICDRFLAIDGLERTDLGDGTTAWDRLIALPQNPDQTWRDGGRPENIAWAIDDLIALARQAAAQ